jgi:hypothetical protein
MGVVMRLPPGLTLRMLSNIYNSRKRQEKIYKNAKKSKVPYNANAVSAELNFRRGIQVASGLPVQQLANYYHRYMNIREANQRHRVRRAAGKFKAGGSVSVVRPALRRELGAFGNNYGNILRSVAYRNASPIRRR